MEFRQHIPLYQSQYLYRPKHGLCGNRSGNTSQPAGLMTLLPLEPGTVSEKTMRGAVQIARWFRDHALRLMGGDGELSPEGNEALQYLVRRGQCPVSVSLIRNTLRKRKFFQREEKLDAALIEVQTAGYVRLMNSPPHETGRPAILKFELHPSLLAKTDAS